MYSQFCKDVNGENYDAPYTFIEPTYSAETAYILGNSQHPHDNMEGGEWFIKNTYEAIRNSPLWTKSLLIITWDEHGGFYDHVKPPSAPSPDSVQGLRHGFKFDQLGVRVPAVVVSPFIARGHIDHRTYDHATIPATVERCFHIEPMTERDRTANDVLGLLTLTSPRDCPKQLRPPAAAAVFANGPSQDEITAAVAARAGEPVDGTELPGFVMVAAKTCREVFPEDRTLVAQAQNCHTCGEAQAYIGSVTRKVEALEAAEARAAGTS
jgi:phospholipase C